MADRFEPKEEELDVDDYRAFFEDHILRSWHLEGQARYYRIGRVTCLTSTMVHNGVRKVTRQPKLELLDRQGHALPLPLLLNKTNAKTIAQLYGKRPADWVGKVIELYPTTTEMQGEVKDCIRVRNQIPGSGRARKVTKPADALPPPGPSIPPSERFDHETATKNVAEGEFDDAE